MVVLGGGPIGLLTIHAAARLGARVLAVEPLTHRRALAARLGADGVFADAADLPRRCADVAIDAVGIEPTRCGAIAAVPAGGSVCVVGLGQAEGRIPMGELVRRGISVRGHYAYTRGDFAVALEQLGDAPPPLDWIDVVGLDEAAEGFRRLVEDPDSVTKVLLDIGNGATARSALYKQVGKMPSEQGGEIAPRVPAGRRSRALQLHRLRPVDPVRAVRLHAPPVQVGRTHTG